MHDVHKSREKHKRERKKKADSHFYNILLNYFFKLKLITPQSITILNNYKTFN